MNALTVLSTNLSDVLALPDERAAVELNQRIGILDQIQRIHERSFAERGIIIREFEKRKLWSYLTDPDTNTPFASLTAWLSCSDFLGCRRTNFESKRVIEQLADVPAEKLVDIPKGNLHVLTQLSTLVRNDPAVLEAAKTDKLLATIERDHPGQHLQTRQTVRFSLSQNVAAEVERAIGWAMEHEGAVTREEAILAVVMEAMHGWLLDEELRALPADEVAT